MGSHQRADQVRSVHVNPLINGLMADGLIRVLNVQPAGDQLWGPSQANVFLHIVSNKVVFKPLAPIVTGALLYRLAVGLCGPGNSLCRPVVHCALAPD